MTDFSMADAQNREFLLPMARTAFREVERSLRENDSDGGQLFNARLETAAEAIRFRLKKLAELCTTEEAAKAANAEVVLYEAGLLDNGINPRSLPVPQRYLEYYQD